MQFVDKPLARRFEACEEMPQVLYARVFQKTRPNVGAAEAEICGGHMVFAGLGSPIGRATGAGLDRSFTAQDLDRIEEFYRLHNAPSQVDLCPLHDAAVFEMFKERGYGIAELNNVLYRKLDPQEEFPAGPAGYEIRRGLREEAAESGVIVERAFFPEGAPEPFRGLLEPLYQMEGALAFVASIDGKIVACGTGYSGASHLRAGRSRNAARVARPRTADGAAACPHGGRSPGWMRLRSRSHQRRNDVATQLRAARISRGLQQGDGDQETLVRYSGSQVT